MIALQAMLGLGVFVGIAWLLSEHKRRFPWREVLAGLALLFYWRVLPVLIRGASLVLQRAFGIGGALGVGTAANVLLSMVESPLVIRPYLKEMNRSELFAPLAWLMGIPWAEAHVAGSLLGVKTILNEMVASCSWPNSARMPSPRAARSS